MPAMKKEIFALFAGVALIAVGCVSTVDGRKTTAVPLVDDQCESRYARPVAQVVQVAKEVMVFNGTLLNDTTQYGTNNVFSIEGRVNQRKVWISSEQETPTITRVVVQVRTKGGGVDRDLCRELDKQIALKLVQ